MTSGPPLSFFSKEEHLVWELIGSVRPGPARPGSFLEAARSFWCLPGLMLHVWAFDLNHTS